MPHLARLYSAARTSPSATGGRPARRSSELMSLPTEDGKVEGLVPIFMAGEARSACLRCLRLWLDLCTTSVIRMGCTLGEEGRDQVM